MDFLSEAATFPAIELKCDLVMTVTDVLVFVL